MKATQTRWVFLCCSLCLLLATCAAAAAERAPRLSILTFGPGDDAFARFGHDAVLVEDPSKPGRRGALVYNYGTFSFSSPLLALDFLKGDLRYWLGVGSLARTMEVYRAYNRSVRAQRLMLEPEAAARTVRFLEHNALPENRFYLYDYYKDNCATRVRDLIDRAYGGALRRSTQNKTGMSYRDHTRRLTESWPLLYFGLELALGPAVDHDLTEWQAMFLPEEVERNLAKLELADGSRTMAVESHDTLFAADRPEPPAHPSPQSPRWLLIGLLAGGVLAGLGALRGRGFRTCFAGTLGLVGLVCGLVGSILLLLWLATSHEVAANNRNALLCGPWLLGLVPLVRDLARPRPTSPWPTRLLAASLCGAATALALQWAPWSIQQTGPTLAVFAPLWVGAAVGLWLRYERPSAAELQEWLRHGRPARSRSSARLSAVGSDSAPL